MQFSVRSDDSVARNQNIYRIFSNRCRNRSNSARSTDHCSNLSIGSSFSEWDVSQRLPHGFLKIRAGKMELGHIKRSFGKIVFECEASGFEMLILSGTGEESGVSDSCWICPRPEDANKTVYIGNERKNAKWSWDEGLDKLTRGHGRVVFYFVTP